ncbi:recombinase family protein [Streptomyces sp. NPDC004393]|uniref:recombinase family protein n=1 Tax=Streptomyces sp. NPDC004533 TaxID=3154278 RepID=UPI0033ADD110
MGSAPADTDGSPALTEALRRLARPLVPRLLRRGDALKITRLDRLSRSVLHLVTLGAELRERGIGLHVIEQGIDSATVEDQAVLAQQL